jgi:hypothetical protein
MATRTLTEDQQRRQDAFMALYAGLPGSNIDKIRKVCSILHCKENSVRIYTMEIPTRVIPDAKLKILQDVLVSQGRRKK